MFTGIITDIGTVLSSEQSPSGKCIVIACSYDPETIDMGASICCSGACMTVVSKGRDEAGRNWFGFDVSPESLARTTLGDWGAGTRVNLERSLAMGSELGGHLVTGHVDATARIADRIDDGGTSSFVIEAPDDLVRFIAEKGSAALDGTSLTVNSVAGTAFSVTLIPHTLEVTTWGQKEAGDKINLEVDLMARYAARLMDFGDAE